MCSWCMDAKHWLDEQGLKYTAVNVGADAAARQRAIELSGQTLVPVIKVMTWCLAILTWASFRHS